MKTKLFNWIKRSLLLMALVVSAHAASFAQDQPLPEEGKEVEGALIGYLTKELDLTPEEAQKFWPVYNQYRKEMRELIKQARKGSEDQLVTQEKALNIRKKYRTEFARVLPQQKVLRVYPGEDRFRQLVIKKIQQRNQNRPMLRQQRRAGRPGQ
jgi:Spy/CpxP family protein refolding chaperone